MSRHVSGLSLWLCACLPAYAGAAAPGSAATPVVITFTEQALKLARATSMYSAGRGAVLQANDLLSAGAGTVLLDAGGSPAALGPDSALYIKNGELVLLKGWLKLAGGAHAPLLATAGLQVDSAGASVILHATADGTEVFAESGQVRVQDTAAAKPRRLAIAAEQFGVRSGAQPLKVGGRPPSAFLAGMPRAFFDPLKSLPLKGAPVAPKRERAATFAELAPLLAGQPSLRQQVEARWAPPWPPRATRAAPAQASTPPSRNIP